MSRTEVFGRMPDGAEVTRICISGGGLTAWISTYGAVLQDLRLDGHGPALVLGFEDFPPYLSHSPYFGATAGRCANRVRQGRFTLDGIEYQLDQNAAGGHCLHGGSVGIGKRLWSLEDSGPSHARLSIKAADGHMGFPGNIEISAQFSLKPGGVLDIAYEAQTDAPTLCNLAHHSYFVLDDSGSILDHRLHIDADRFLPADQTFIPSGEVRDVTGTGYDFRLGRTIRAANADGHIDTNFCLSNSREELRDIARLESDRSGVSMGIRSTEPGLQVYDAARIDIPALGLGGMTFQNFAGLALEPQIWPDAINHPDWAQPILRPGETYRQHTQFVFKKEAA